ncbi:DUF4245 domain-containing protein [Micrococcus sp.]|uniref:DUF4245 domain-containing protein n=1 Tax=Micrococcus sp. TaxID=1271 RepID=UPI002A9118F5|nr:DUF4245 domain-containing protein [Micrococcus sp.]MDY6055350.1 DUF4245 domain-containing protein [Micrococcus sp.]
MSTPAPEADGHAARPLAPAPRPVLTAKQSMRARQPWIAMVLSALAVMGVVLALGVLHPSPAQPPLEDRVDVADAAGTVPRGAGLPALAPDVPEGWTSSYARLVPLDGVQTWDVGWVVTPSVFAGLHQADDADPTWVGLRVGTAPAVGTREVDGIVWSHHAPRDSRDQHLVAEVDGTTVVLTSNGGLPVLEDLARAVAKETQ